MDQCSYTLVLPAETHPDVLRRLVALFTGSLEAWEVVDGWAAASVVREAGQSLPMVESLIDRLQTWGLQLPFTLVEHATASSVGECHRYAPGLGTLSQPWAHGQVWVDPTRLERLVDDYSPAVSAPTSWAGGGWKPVRPPWNSEGGGCSLGLVAGAR